MKSSKELYGEEFDASKGQYLTAKSFFEYQKSLAQKRLNEELDKPLKDRDLYLIDDLMTAIEWNNMKIREITDD